MKRLLYILLAFLSFMFHSCDRETTAYYDVGVLNNQQTIAALKPVVDSVNLQFRRSGLAENFYAFPQAKISYISVRSHSRDSIRMIKDLLKNGKSFAEISNEYKDLIEEFIDTTSLIRDLNYSQSTLRYFYISNEAGLPYLRVTIPEVKAGARYIENNVYQFFDQDHLFEAVHCYTGLQQQPLPLRYARQVQYAEYLMDKDTHVYTGRLEPHVTYHDLEYPPEVDTFYSLMGVSSDKLNERGWHEADWLIKNHPKYKIALENAAQALIKDSLGDFIIEKYSERYLGPATNLRLKRNRFINVFCGMSPAPHIHTQKIALLAAECKSTDVFLRAYLDLLTAQFDRTNHREVNDGINYVKTLEELDIHVTDFLAGIIFNVDTRPSKPYYYGYNDAMSWAIAEMKDRAAFEKSALQTIRDKELDPLNRVLIFHLYTRYLYYLKDSAEAKTKLKALQMDKSLPSYLTAAARQFKLEKEPIQNPLLPL